MQTVNQTLKRQKSAENDRQWQNAAENPPFWKNKLKLFFFFLNEGSAPSHLRAKLRPARRRWKPKQEEITQKQRVIACFLSWSLRCSRLKEEAEAHPRTNIPRGP